MTPTPTEIHAVTEGYIFCYADGTQALVRRCGLRKEGEILRFRHYIEANLVKIPSPQTAKDLGNIFFNNRLW